MGAAMNRLYDLVLITDPSAPEGRAEQIANDAQAMIESGGTLVGRHDWGSRRLAYEIDHRAEGTYTLFQFEGDNDLLERLNHTLKITDGVLRFRVIEIKPGTEPPPAPRQDAPRTREGRPEGGREGREGRVAARAAADAG